MKQSYKFFQNRDCKYFPCHDIDEEKMNCMFCYCPLYALKDQCGGNPVFLKGGVKSCEKCLAPHNGEKGWDFINDRMKAIIDLAKFALPDNNQ